MTKRIDDDDDAANFRTLTGYLDLDPATTRAFGATPTTGAIFNGPEFDPRSYETTQGGLLGRLAPQALYDYRLGGGFARGADEPSPLDSAQWPVGPVGAPSALNENLRLVDELSPLDTAQWPAGPVGRPEVGHEVVPSEYAYPGARGLEKFADSLPGLYRAWDSGVAETAARFEGQPGDFAKWIVPLLEKKAGLPHYDSLHAFLDELPTTESRRAAIKKNYYRDDEPYLPQTRAESIVQNLGTYLLDAVGPGKVKLRDTAQVIIPATVDEIFGKRAGETTSTVVGAAKNVVDVGEHIWKRYRDWAGDVMRHLPRR